MRPKILRALRTIAITYVLLCLIVGVFQRRIIYFPFHKTETDMIAEGRRLGCEPWRDADGAILGWKRVNRGAGGAATKEPAANRIVLFHGNTGYALHRIQYLDGFEQLENGRLWEVYLFEYPGFGARSGALGEKPFIEAGLHALNALRAADARPVYLLGESLGSGLACALAQREPKQIAGLFLFTPYGRLGDVAASHFPYLPVRQMLRDPWDNVAAVRDYQGPAAVFIAGDDEVVTAKQGQMIFESLKGRKRLWTEAGARHNTVDFSPYAPWWREVSDFLLDVTPARLSTP